MNIVVTRKKVDYSSSGFLKVATLEEACEVRGTIDVLVYNNSSEDSDKRIACLGSLKDRVTTLIYVCNEKSIDMAVKMMVIGSNGKYIDDEFFLESADELEVLVKSLEDVTALVELGGVNVLSDFFNRYLKNGSSDFNANYLSVVKNAVNALVTEYNEQRLEVIQMSETASDIFSNTSALLADMQREKENMQEILKKVSENIAEQPVSIRKPVGSSVSFFPRVNYMKERSIIRVKEIGDCKFLISLMMGFRVYLESIKNLRPKLIVIEPVSEVLEKLYEDYPWVTVRNSKSMGNYYHDVVFTNYPSLEVLPKLLDDDKYDTFIVVDCTSSYKDHILNSKGNSVKYAVGGTNSISKYRLRVGECFSSVVGIDGAMFTVPVFQNYPNDKAPRERLYLSELGSSYEKLMVGIRRR